MQVDQGGKFPLIFDDRPATRKELEELFIELPNTDKRVVVRDPDRLALIKKLIHEPARSEKLTGILPARSNRKVYKKLASSIESVLEELLYRKSDSFKAADISKFNSDYDAFKYLADLAESLHSSEALKENFDAYYNSFLLKDKLKEIHKKAAAKVNELRRGFDLGVLKSFVKDSSKFLRRGNEFSFASDADIDNVLVNFGPALYPALGLKLIFGDKQGFIKDLKTMQNLIKKHLNESQIAQLSLKPIVGLKGSDEELVEAFKNLDEMFSRSSAGGFIANLDGLEEKRTAISTFIEKRAEKHEQEIFDSIMHFSIFSNSCQHGETFEEIEDIIDNFAAKLGIDLEMGKQREFSLEEKLSVIVKKYKKVFKDINLLLETKELKAALEELINAWDDLAERSGLVLYQDIKSENPSMSIHGMLRMTKLIQSVFGSDGVGLEI